MPTHSSNRLHNTLSPKSSILLAPPNGLEQQQQFQNHQQRRFSEMPVDQRRFSDVPVDRQGLSQADRLNSRQKSKRSQSVMYRQGRPGQPRRSSKSASRQDSIAENHVDLMNRRRSVRM